MLKKELMQKRAARKKNQVMIKRRQKNHLKNLRVTMRKKRRRNVMLDHQPNK